MKFFVVSLFFCVIVTTCEARKCSPVICTLFDYNMDETFSEMGLKYFTRDLPQSGICLEGSVVYTFHGKYFGYPGQTRCVCFPSEGPDVLGEDIKCGPGVPECPRTIDLYQNETLRNFYKRVQRSSKKESQMDVARKIP
jgi:hypothetical protein